MRHYLNLWVTLSKKDGDHFSLPSWGKVTMPELGCEMRWGTFPGTSGDFG